MRVIALLSTLLLSGCLATAPKFPDIPDQLKTKRSGQRNY
jgi:hypothetical protein